MEKGMNTDVLNEKLKQVQHDKRSMSFRTYFGISNLEMTMN